MFKGNSLKLNEYEAKALDISRKMWHHEEAIEGFRSFSNVKRTLGKMCKNERLKDVWINDEKAGDVLLTDVLAKVYRLLDEVSAQVDTIVAETTPREEMSINDVLKYIEGFNDVIKKEGRMLNIGENMESDFPIKAVERYLWNCGYYVVVCPWYDSEGNCMNPQFSLRSVKKGVEQK